MATQPAQLQHEALGLRDVVFQGITHIAPAINVVFTLPVIAAQAGATMPLSLLLSTVVCFFIANTVAQFSRYVPSSGGYYTFVSRGLGPRYGFLTTWSYLIYDIIGPAAAVGFLGFALSGFLQSGTGINIPWWIFSVATAVIVWILTYFGIRLSTRTTAILGGIEMLIMLALGITFLLHPGAGSSAGAPLNPGAAPTGFGGVIGGMVFSILALSGFEAPAPLAEETKRPNRFISQAIFLSLLIVGIFYIFMAYASAIGWGTGNIAAFAANANPYYTLAQKLWGVGWWLIFFAIINSTLAVGIACTNAATRVMYTMGLAGTLPSALAKIHPRHKTPYVAVHVEQIFQIVSFMLVGIFYVFMAYASAIGWGTGNMAAFAANANPYYALAQKLWGVGWWLIFFAIINSTLAVGIACTNAATRVMYTMGLAGTLPAALAKIHPVHKTPYIAVHVEQILLIVSFLLVGIFLGAGQIFGFLGTIATLAVIVLYVLANIALTTFVRHERPADFSIWQHAVVPIVGTLLLLPVMFVTVWPIPAYPINLTPYIFVALMVIGLVVMLVVIARRPEALDQESSMLISTVQGESEEPLAG